MSGSPYNNPEPMESACPSETEEAISDDDEDDDKMEDDDRDRDNDSDADHCQCPKSLIALPPLRLSEAVSTSNSSAESSSNTTKSSCWKCAGEFK